MCLALIFVTRHIPMKRELKVVLCVLIDPGYLVTRHIPMKRELKESRLALPGLTVPSHKAYPDEKGTESEMLWRA